MLDEIEARASAATPTPWIARYTFGARGVFLIEGDAANGHGMHIAEACELIKEKWVEQANNAAFICSARSDVPALVKTLRKAVDYIRADLSPKGRTGLIETDLATLLSEPADSVQKGGQL
jgi:hypothetical protein